uniref:Uncharacterized protein n=1 Tax=viral metagenome TaxID=1070528 RepID=A0A6M3LDD3_9ZZZZ
MALRNQPYLPLYVDDYLTDEKLNMCSAASQGVYIKILCIFHKSENYGGILLRQRDKQKDKQIFNFAYRFAKLLPFTYDEILPALNELIEEKVIEIDGDLIFQKRMIHDNKISLIRSESGKIGGNKTGSKFALAKNEANSVNVNESVIKKDKKSLEYLEGNIDNFRIDEFSNIDIDKEYKKFRDYLKSKGKQYKDYSAGFRNWLRSDFVPKIPERKPIPFGFGCEPSDKKGFGF